MKYTFDQIAYNITKKKQPVDSDREFYIGLEHIDPETFTISRWGSDITPAGEKLIISKGDILFGKRRAYQRKVAIAPFDGIFSAHGMVLRPKEDVINPDFFPFFIASDQFMETAVRISVGGLSPTINWKDLKIQEFELPPIEDQEVLADKLWAAYRLKEAYKRLLVATDEMVKSQFIEMFCKYTPTTRLEDLSETIIAGGDKPKDCTTDRTESNVYPVIANGIENDGIIGYSSSYRINSPSLTISARGTIGVTVIRSGMYTPIIRLIVIKPLRNINLTYLKYQLDYNGFQPTGAVQGQLTVPNVKNKMIPVPPLSEQEEFAAIVRQADKSKFELKKAIEAIDQVIKSLING